MKKMFLRKSLPLIMASVMGMSLLATGCAKETDDKDKGAADDTIEVSSLQDFIDAIEPGANIVFKKGTYDFTPELEELYDGDGEEFNEEHKYVQIVDCYDGVELVIQNVDGLTISAKDGKKVELQVEPRYADVIRFEYCENISISNLVMGHTEDLGSCAGDVLEFDDCENISLEGMDLYGCGTYAVSAFDTTSITVTDSTLRDCSYGLVWISECEDVTFKSCEMTGTSGYTMLDIYESNVTFNKCNFEDNTCDDGFVTFSDANDIKFKACTFGALESAYVNHGDVDSAVTGISFDSKCVFDASLPGISAGGSGHITIDGNIDTVGEILESIQSDTDIVIADGYYNLSEFIDTIDVDEWNDSHDFVKIEEVFDGYQVVITNCDRLSIRSSSENAENCEIVTDPRYAAVFELRNCEDIYLEGMTLGHTETGTCSGPVIGLSSSDYIVIDAMDLYGCGVYGIEAYYSGNVDVYNTRIHDCSFGPFFLTDLSDEFYFYGCTFDESDGQGYIGGSQYNTHFQECVFGENETFEVLSCPWVTYDSCIFAGEDYYPANACGKAVESDYTKISYDDYISNEYYDSVGGPHAFSAFYATDDKDGILLPYYDDIDEAYYHVHLILFEDGHGMAKGLLSGSIVYFEFEKDGDELACTVDPNEGYPIMKDGATITFYDSDEYSRIIKFTCEGHDIWFHEAY